MSAREKQTFVVFAFLTTHDALSAETLLKDMAIDVVPIPSPRTLGSRCGIAMRVPPGQAVDAERYLERSDMPIESRVEIEDW